MLNILIGAEPLALLTPEEPMPQTDFFFFGVILWGPAGTVPN